MDAEVAGIPHCLMLNFDEIMVTADLHCKTVVTCDRTVFRRKTQKTRHVTLGLCLSPLGRGPPPFFVLLGAGRVREFELLQRTGTLNISNSAHGWMTTGLFEERAVAFAKWTCDYRAQIFPNDQNARRIIPPQYVK
jgi:hypothetical protein